MIVARTTISWCVIFWSWCRNHCAGARSGRAAADIKFQRVGIVRTSRRDFVKLLTSSGIAVSVSRLAFAEQPDFVSRETLPGRRAWNPAANGTGRIDGVAKVTGSKLYAADFRAAGLPGWPAKTSHAMLIRATDATYICDALDLSRLTGAVGGKPTSP